MAKSWRGKKLELLKAQNVSFSLIEDPLTKKKKFFLDLIMNVSI